MSDSFFIEGENYDIKEGGTNGYMRFADGDNVFRILGSFSEGTAIRGLLYWKTIDGSRRPQRVPSDTKVAIADLETNKFGELDIPKDFWAFPVWNYEEKRVQILEVTQKSILKFIKAQIQNVKWGDPRNYDFIVNRGKEGDRTVYTISTNPKESLPGEAMKAYSDINIDMSKLFKGEDPYAV